MTQKSPFAGWCNPPSRLKSFLFAAALPVSLSIFANLTAMAMPEGSCPAGSAVSTDAAPEACAQDASGAVNGAILQSLDALTAHGLDPARYIANGASPRDAWLLAATHLRRGAIDAETLAPRLEADAALAETFNALPTDADAEAYSAALNALAPTSSLYAALQTELAQHQQSPLTSAEAKAASDAQARMASLRASLERLRWLPRENTERQIYANIPTFEVVALTGDTEVSRHVAIFGEEDRQTPEFSDSITYLEFSPWWNVPASMARRDKLPDFQNDPGEIEELGYKVLDASGNPVN
ncbi:L,D-transpeptidase family protein, partial [Hyphomonas sp.]|uniref:L,D-transpeptidase family protein n=1 Tax=Hyphomonas sp. TaxID=87 RepID=UPI003919D3D3